MNKRNVELNKPSSLVVRDATLANEILDFILEQWRTGAILGDIQNLIIETITSTDLAVCGVLFVPNQEVGGTSRAVWVDWDAGLSDWVIV